MFILNTATTANNKAILCSSNRCKTKARASDCYKHCSTLLVISGIYIYLSTEAPPTWCPNFLYARCSQSEERWLPLTGGGAKTAHVRYMQIIFEPSIMQNCSRGQKWSCGAGCFPKMSFLSDNTWVWLWFLQDPVMNHCKYRHIQRPDKIKSNEARNANSQTHRQIVNKPPG